MNAAMFKASRKGTPSFQHQMSHVLDRLILVNPMAGTDFVLSGPRLYTT